MTTDHVQTLYTARTHTTGGRDGRGQSDDGRLDVQLGSPGSSRPGTNPEQLFAVGWSACFIGAMGLAAQAIGVRLPADAAVDASVDLNKGADGYSLSAQLRVSLPGLPRDTAYELVKRAHETCPYSKMTRGNIAVGLELV
ncbi:organic hydroperoxide resistance protein [Mitsuaria sp. GD03876]|uniref:organic hydroperoxide resistance protein n=1 Tax=Mitsuaria sp. GD03876 TaxID=2975399 RepID=UPI00244CB0B6|nr:organic hydroperoxide resistance protein [Mitsuaria sp. GD03876]MDH0867815.1 organic hydroperoxide resistance protein [Mitsuaria sp. GD03876]